MGFVCLKRRSLVNSVHAINLLHATLHVAGVIVLPLLGKALRNLLNSIHSSSSDSTIGGGYVPLNHVLLNMTCKTRWMNLGTVENDP